MTATVERKKVRYFNRETKQLAWAYPDELPEYAREAAPADKVNDYSAEIEAFQDELRTAIADRRATRDEAGRTEALARSEQFKLAIDVYREAEMIPAEPIQFGAYADTWSFRLPPRTPEYIAENPRQQALFNRYVTSNPIEIAYLRRLIREQTIDGLRETPLNWYYARGVGQRDGEWLDPDTYERLRKNGTVV
jgi:hypothetical protein